MSQKKINDVDLFKSLVEQKKTVAEIAELFDTSDTTVRHTAKKLGISLNNKSANRQIMADNFDEIKRMYEEEGMSFQKISVQLGVPKVTLRRYYYNHIFNGGKKSNVDFDAIKEYIKRERKSGVSIREIADRIGADYYELEEYCRKNGIRNEFKLKQLFDNSEIDESNLTYAKHTIHTFKRTETVKIYNKTVTKTYTDITDYFMGNGMGSY